MITLFVLQASGGGQLPFILMMGGMLAVAYFFIIRPQTQRETEAKNYIDTIEVGQQVVTAGGIYGKVKRIDGDLFHVEIDKMTTVRVDKESIAVEKTRKLAAPKTQENA
jgi:preprotein translocase subunit YajC